MPTGKENSETVENEIEYEIEGVTDDSGKKEEEEPPGEDKDKDKGKEDDVEVEVVDDTPPEDQGRTPAPPMEEPSEDELAQYSADVQKRIKKYTKNYHDERRAKEKAMREAQEMEGYTRKLMEQNKQLQERLNKGETALISETQKRAERELEAAKAAYRTAYESGETDAVMDAQEKLAEAKWNLERAKSFRASPSQNKDDVVQQPQEESKQAPKKELDPKVKDWTEKNTWFGTDSEMTAFALGYHNKLVREEGVDPSSDDYYERLNARMREVFPDRFEDTNTEKTGKKPAKSSSVVAGATRSTAPKKVVLTETQVKLAERLGVPLDVYAKQVAEDRRNDTDG